MSEPVQVSDPMAADCVCGGYLIYACYADNHIRQTYVPDLVAYVDLCWVAAAEVVQTSVIRGRTLVADAADPQGPTVFHWTREPLLCWDDSWQTGLVGCITTSTTTTSTSTSTSTTTTSTSTTTTSTTTTSTSTSTTTTPEGCSDCCNSLPNTLTATFTQEPYGIAAYVTNYDEGPPWYFFYPAVLTMTQDGGAPCTFHGPVNGSGDPVDDSGRNLCQLDSVGDFGQTLVGAPVALTFCQNPPGDVVCWVHLIAYGSSGNVSFFNEVCNCATPVTLGNDTDATVTIS